MPLPHSVKNLMRNALGILFVTVFSHNSGLVKKLYALCMNLKHTLDKITVITSL